MKRFFAFVLAMMLMISAVAIAEGKLTVTSKNLIVFPGDDTGYFFAKVENNNEIPVGVSSGDLVIFTTDDDLLISESYVSSLPSYVLLQPGEYLYVRDYLWDDALIGADIGDYKFSMPISSSSTEIEKITCEAELDFKGAGSYDNYVYVTVNNDSEEAIDGATVVVAVYDQNDNIIFVDSYNFSSVIINPNSSVSVKFSVSSDLMGYYAENGIAPTTIDAYVCIEK